jgi:hypothetical protein
MEGVVWQQHGQKDDAQGPPWHPRETG